MTEATGSEVGNGAAGAAMVEVAADSAAPAKKKTEYTPVVMSDGRTVQFAGNRQASKDPLASEDGTDVGIRIDFRNGATVALWASEIPEATKMRAIVHGLSQKVGDEYADVKTVDDMVIAAEEMIQRLKAGDWSVARAPGDSFAGASIVIRAVAEVTGKSADEIKKFLQGKLDAAKAAGEKLSRHDLYESFKNPNSKTGAVIERLEREERAKSTKVSANDLLSEIEG